ncbi:flagellar basal-body rod protein FlgG [Malikia spinosa]|uniref:Flagellar basal-body rod protein FlgG n=1 Tax=Malikia spinosa TaxID=86180 RepID=A0A2S9KDA2_9BURK|nr:flagellar basal-body rod protein FlgG [Malikia spinosa]PRD68439.1 flagellar basal-body rod protein FlgG [Malikia spinosa]
MLRSLWVAKTGLEAQQAQMDVITNNIANVNTNGFKRSRAVFEDLLYQTVRQPGAPSSQQTQFPTGLQFGTGVKPVATERLHTQGNLMQTGNSKDIAIDGKGFFQVQMPDGTVGYTRDGSFHVDNQGQLVTSSGYLLLPQITVPADAQVLTVSRSGQVSVTVQGNAAAQELGTLQLASFINPAGLEARGENLYYETGASGAPIVNDPGTNGLGQLSQGFVEAANVNVVEEMVNMVQAQRAYELNSKAVTASDQMLQKIAQL